MYTVNKLKIWCVGCHKTASEMEEVCRLRQWTNGNGCRSAVYTRELPERKQRNGNAWVFIIVCKSNLPFVLIFLSVLLLLRGRN